MRKETLMAFTLACVIVFGMYWVANKSLGNREAERFHNSDQRANSYAESPGAGTSQPPSASQMPGADARNDVNGSTRLLKCSVNGKTYYSNQKCPQGAKQKTLELHDSAGIVSPPKETLEALAAKRLVTEAEARQNSAPVSVSLPKAECEVLNREVERLDAMGRQPQSGEMMDWIRQQRYNARNRQFAIHC
jgi:hypothetical protein